MKIREVNENKKQFIALLLLADEQENMVDRYLEKGTMYVLEDGDVKAECVVTDEDNGILEIKNIAVDPQNQGKGYGKALIDFLASKYADEYPYFGPKKTLKWMEQNHPIAFAHYKTALEDFSVDSLKNWITYIKNANDTF